MSQTQQNLSVLEDDYLDVTVPAVDKEQQTDDQLFEDEDSSTVGEKDETETDKPKVKGPPHRFQKKWPSTYEEATPEQKEQMVRKFISTNNKEAEKNKRKQAQNKAVKEATRAKKKQLAVEQKKRRELQKWKARKGIIDDQENDQKMDLNKLLLAYCLAGKF